MRQRSLIPFLSAVALGLALSSCATRLSAIRPEPDRYASASLGAGALLGIAEARRIPARKTRALLSLATPRILDVALEMDTLEAFGYADWRKERRESLSDVRAIRIAFGARLPEGGVEAQSGMLYLPVPARVEPGEPAHPLAVTWLVFCKGTEHLRDYVPSREGSHERSMMESAAALGFAVWAPDYAGMGDARGVQEYCVPESLAASALDGLAAARTYLAGSAPGYAESGRLAVLGYSQGGLAAMATLKTLGDGAIEAPGLRVTVGYPLGAPLDLLIGVPFLEEESSIVARPDYSLLLALGWARAYPDDVRLEEILRPEVIEHCLPLFDGTRDGDELCRLVARALGRKTGAVLDSDLYRPEYLEALRKDPESLGLYRRQSAARLDRWTPPSDLCVRLAASPQDEVVPFLNSERAYAWMRETNPEADASLVRLATARHAFAGFEAFLYALMDLDRRESEEEQ